MAIKPEQIIAPQGLTGTLAQYYESPANKFTQINKLTVTNVNTTVEVVDIHVVPDGDTPGAANRILSQKSLDVDQAFPVYQIEGHTLKPGDTVHAKSSTTDGVIIMGSGVTVV